MLSLKSAAPTWANAPEAIFAGAAFNEAPPSRIATLYLFCYESEWCFIDPFAPSSSIWTASF